MIAVTGSTGKLGQHVIRELVKKVSPNNIVALARNASKAKELKDLGVQVREADYENTESLLAALKGVEKLLLISSSEVGKRAEQHKKVITAAKANGVKHLVYTSVLRANTSTLGLAAEHVTTEAEILSSEIPYTFLRNGWYLENHTENMISAIDSGVFLGAAGEGHFSSASRLDYALAAVAVLTQEGHQKKTYELGGSTSFTLTQLTQVISELAGKNVVYKDLSEIEYENLLVSFGIPQGFAHLLADSDTGAKNGSLFTDSKDLEKLIGRKTTLLKDAVQSALRK